MTRTPHPTTVSVPGLEDAFAAEVRLRLPRLLDAAPRVSKDSRVVTAVLTDVHSLASSAALLGEDVAAHAARECEQLVLPYAVAGTPAPQAVADQLCGAIEAIHLALGHWAHEVVPAQRRSEQR